MRRTDEHYRRESDLTWGPEKAVAGDLAPRKGCGKTMDSTPFPGRVQTRMNLNATDVNYIKINANRSDF